MLPTRLLLQRQPQLLFSQLRDSDPGSPAVTIPTHLASRWLPSLRLQLPHCTNSSKLRFNPNCTSSNSSSSSSKSNIAVVCSTHSIQNRPSLSTKRCPPVKLPPATVPIGGVVDHPSPRTMCLNQMLVLNSMMLEAIAAVVHACILLN